MGHDMKKLDHAMSWFLVAWLILVCLTIGFFFHDGFKQYEAAYSENDK